MTTTPPQLCVPLTEVTELSHTCVSHNEKQGLALFGGVCPALKLCLSFFSKFRLSYYPHRLESFKELMVEAFHGKLEHQVYGDFKSYTPGQTVAPCYFIHVCRKTA